MSEEGMRLTHALEASAPSERQRANALRMLRWIAGYFEVHYTAIYDEALFAFVDSEVTDSGALTGEVAAPVAETSSSLDRGALTREVRALRDKYKGSAAEPTGAWFALNDVLDLLATGETSEVGREPDWKAAYEEARDEYTQVRRGLLVLLSTLKADRANPMAPIRMPWAEIAPAAAKEIRRLRAPVERQESEPRETVLDLVDDDLAKVFDLLTEIRCRLLVLPPDPEPAEPREREGEGLEGRVQSVFREARNAAPDTPTATAIWHVERDVLRLLSPSAEWLWKREHGESLRALALRAISKALATGEGEGR